MREIIFPQAKQDSILITAKFKLIRGIEIGFDALLDFYRRRVLDQVAQFSQKQVAAAGPPAFPQGEYFLELVEDQHQHQRLAFRSAELKFPPVKVSPEHLVRLWKGCVHQAGLGNNLFNSRFDLTNQINRARRKVQTKGYRKKVLTAKPWKESGLQERGLSQPGLTKQHRQEVAADPAQQFADFLSPSIEISARLFTIGGQTRPRVIRICSTLHRFFGHQCSSFPVSFRNLSANSAVTRPPGSFSQCVALNRSGTSAEVADVLSMTTGTIKIA